jgi:FlaA1/EpsC-like NDP-sugar epimerase
LKHALEHSSGDQVNIVAFIEENPKLWKKTIENVKIYPTAQIEQIVKSKQVKSIFIADENRDINLKNNLIDFCLANNIVLKIIPALQNWIDGELNVRQLKDVRIEDLLNRPTIHLAKDHIQKYIQSKRVLITGAAGSIGREIARQIATIDPELLILCDQTETGLYELEYELEQISGVKKSYQIYVGDIRDKKNMQHLFATYHPEIVIHAAAYKHVPLMEKNASEAIKNNVLGTKILVDLAEKFAVDRFLFISTDKAINPTNVMGASKRIAELYIEATQKKSNSSNGVNGHYEYKLNGENGHSRKKHFTKFIITRFGNVLGSNGSVIPRFKQQIDKGGPLMVTHPDITRFFMTIPEACSLVLEAGTMGKGGEIFIFDMGKPVKIVDLAHKMIKLAGFIPGKDIRIEYSGLRPGEKLYEEFMNNAEKLIPTHNKKIMITEGSNYDYESIKEMIAQLIETASNNEDIEVVKQMKRILPEYKSKNSDFEILDEKSSLISL